MFSRTLRFFALAAIAATVYAQSNTSTLDGTVTDPQGSAVAKAEVTVRNTETGQNFRTGSDDRGHWAVPSLATALYSVTVKSAGFKTATKSGVKMDAGIPATVNIVLEVGAVSDSIEVTGGAEVVESASATVSSDLSGRQVSDLPIPSRNATDLIITLPGTQSPAGPRNTTFDGLPQATVNMTLDGVNIQDNINKNGSGGAFYPLVYPRTDAIEEVSVTNAASGAESLGEGAIQVKFVTKSGTNNWHGGTFLQERNTYFDANTYFNNIDGLSRDRILLHQMGAHIGGPILKNKLFIFFNYEVFRFPQSWNESSIRGQLTVLTDSARSGLFQYKDSTGTVRGVNLYNLAAANGLPSTPDPTIGATLSQISQASAFGSLTSRIASANDYNRNNFNFQASGSQKIDFPTGKLDYVINSKQHWDITGGVNPYRLFPDGINGVLPAFPGSGTVLGSKVVAGQREGFWTGATSLRSTWTSTLTSEIRYGIGSGNVLFSNDVTPNLFSPWNGYAPTLGFVTNPYSANSLSRRNDPVKQLNGVLSWVKGSHLITTGASYSRISEYTQSLSTQIIPRVTFGMTSNDPALAAFSSANFPGASSSDLSNAESLYALLTGRVSSITKTVVLDDKSHVYGNSGVIARYKQQEYGFFGQDSWKITRRLTLTAGLRLENQTPFHSLNNTFTRPGYAGLFGTSGVGNLFMPGASGGAAPTLSLVTPDTTGYSGTHFFSPTVGAAYVIPKMDGWLGKIFSSAGSSVLRGGYSIATAREQFTVPWSNNQGVSINVGTDPVSTNTSSFGPAGSVLFRNPLPSVPFSSTAAYPLPVLPGNAIYDYDPNLKVRYVSSWNVGWQRPLDKDTVVEVRYVGNQSSRTWATVNLNEVNVVENGFNTQFQAAQNNLAIANGVTVAQLATLTSLKSTNFFNQNLPGQTAVPILSTALASTANSTLATYVAQGQSGAFANSIAGNTTQMGRLVAGGYPANLFQVNPATGGSAVNLTTNQGGTNYNSMQVEVRRRLSHGLLLGASYTLSHSLSTGNLLTLRNRDGVTYPSAFDQRHGIKGNWVYELPVGDGKAFLGSLHNGIAKKAVEGWQLAGIVRLQSGTPSELLSGRFTFNGTTDSGVVLHNLTTSQLQNMIGISKQPNGLVDYLPQSLINNTLAAFNLIPQAVDTTQPYIGPATTPGQFGNQIFVYGPWFTNLDLSLVKRTTIHEKQTIEFRVQTLNVFNHANFFLVPNSAGNITINSTFGQTRNAFNDINSTNNPGSRIFDFQIRYSF